ncbi:MAG TPA: iron chelate uptake ABC transporter family permease subunit [Chloroflexota bacterium]|nr:iron chelate uptake ABC transporter family permease subunit [Chloroflexota bacterium]
MTTATLRPIGVRYTPFQLWLRLGVLPLLLVLALIMATIYGAVGIGPSEVLGILLSSLGIPTGHSWPATDVAIIWQLRFVRVITAALIGAALATSGAVFQAVLRNPLADPFVIGTSSGAILGVALAVTIPLGFAWLGFGAVQIMAFLGAMVAIGIAYVLARVDRKAPTMTLLLAGFAVSTLMMAAMWLVVYQAGQTDRLFNWTMGSLADTYWSQLRLLAPLILILIVACWLFVRDLNALLLGEEQAAHLGLGVERVKVGMIILASLLTGLAVSVSGVIGFVGLVVPHVTRLIYGPDHRILLPATAFLGATYLVLADLLARTAEGAGGEIPLGIVTALIGAPFFLYLLRRSGDAYRF